MRDVSLSYSSFGFQLGTRPGAPRVNKAKRSSANGGIRPIRKRGYLADLRHHSLACLALPPHSPAARPRAEAGPGLEPEIVLAVFLMEPRNSVVWLRIVAGAAHYGSF